jgi:hypothetical protein
MKRNRWYVTEFNYGHIEGPFATRKIARSYLRTEKVNGRFEKGRGYGRLSVVKAD